jgi:hypothetical protein
MIDPVEAASAFKSLKAEAAQAAAREPWASRRAA